MDKVIVPHYIAHIIGTGKAHGHESYDIIKECFSGVKLSINKEYMETKHKVQQWLQEDKEHLLLLTKAVLYGYEVNQPN